MRKITFAAKFKNLDDIRDFVGGIAEEMGFSDKEIYSIELATDEACTNIIEHAYGGEGDNELEIYCDDQNGKLKIVLHDWGKPFDPESVAEPNLNATLSERKIGGLGLYLMRKLMDDVVYETSADTGNTLTMTKRKGGDV